MATKKKTAKKASRKSATKKTSRKKGPLKKTAHKKTAHKKTTRKKSTRKYGEVANKKVGRALHEKKRGTLRSGGSGKKVTSRKQAIAIGLSQARKRGAKVPKKKG